MVLDAFCGDLLAHAKHLHPTTSLSCEAASDEVQEDVYSPRNAGAVVAAQLKKRTTPIYPQKAKDLGQSRYRLR